MAKTKRYPLLKFSVGELVDSKGNYCVVGAVGKACGLSYRQLTSKNERQILRLAQKKFRFEILYGATTDGYCDMYIHNANDTKKWHTVRKWLLKYDDLYNKVKKYALKD